MANITKYDDNGKQLWRISGYLGVDPKTGKQKNINRKGFKTKKEATQSLNKAIKRLENGDNTVQRKSLTYEELYHEWLEIYKNEVRESSYHTTKRMFELNILPELADLLIDKISAPHLQKFVNKLYKKSTSYRKRYNYAKKPIELAYQRGYIKTNPCDLVHVPTKKLDYNKEKKTKDFWDKEELNKFMDALYKNEDSYKFIALFRLLAYTGIRRGECLALRWNDVNFIDGLLRIDETFTVGLNSQEIINEPKTESSKRTITLDNDTLNILKEWKKEQAKLLIGFGFNALGKDQFIFTSLPNNRHLCLSAPRKVLKRVCDKYGLEMINIHGFRHTHCSLLFEAGVSMKDVMERLGHKDIQTTMNVYAHVTPQSRDESAEKFARFLEANN